MNNKKKSVFCCMVVLCCLDCFIVCWFCNMNFVCLVSVTVSLIVNHLICFAVVCCSKKINKIKTLSLQLSDIEIVLNQYLRLFESKTILSAVAQRSCVSTALIQTIEFCFWRITPHRATTIGTKVSRKSTHTHTGAIILCRLCFCSAVGVARVHLININHTISIYC